MTATIADRIGRKRTLQLFMIPGILCLVWMAFATDPLQFCVARFIQGMSYGSPYYVLPMYVGEVAEPHNRGTLGCFMSFFVCSGILFAYIVGPYLTVRTFSLVCAIPPCVFLALFSLFVPESPYYLVAKNDKAAAEASLKKLRAKSDASIQKELIEITTNVKESFANKAKITDMFRSKGLFRGFVISMGLMFFHQSSGTNILIAYMQPIFSASGTSIPSDLSSILIGVVQIITLGITAVAVYKLGRRTLLLFSIFGSFMAHMALGYFFYLQASGYDVSGISWLPIASILTFIISFNLGFSPVCWAIMGELFPPNIKVIASIFGCTMNMVTAFSVTTCFPYLNEMLGMAWSFWLFGACCAGGFVFVYFVVPETKGKSLQDIQVMLNEGKM